MWIQHFVKFVTSTSVHRRSTRRRPLPCRLCLETLEDRRLLSFTPAVIYPVGLTPLATVASDFNNDGRLDLAVANRGENTVSVLLGNGEGALQAAPTSETGHRPHSVLAGDMNADGKTDLVTVNNWDDFGHNGDLSVLLGDGDGLFQTPQGITLPAQTPPDYPHPREQTPFSAVLCDLNTDGWLDLVVGGRTMYSVVIGYDGDTGNPIYETHIDGYVNVLLGYGNGTFGQGDAYHLDTSVPNHLVVGDFNGNGKLDVVTNAYGGLTTLLGNGDGTLQAPRMGTGFGYWPVGRSLPVADFDRDGTLDVLMGNAPNSVMVMLGNGDGTFRPSEDVYVGAIHAALAADVNADIKPDVVVLNSNYADEFGTEWISAAQVLLGTGEGKLAKPINSDLGIPPDSYFKSAVLADFDGDGFPDLAGAASYDDFGYGYDYQGFVALAHNNGLWAPPPPPTPTITISDVMVTEDNTGTRAATFTVTLSTAFVEVVTFSYATADGSATVDSDYQAVSGTLMIPAGETTGTITVLVNGDHRAEPNETFIVNVSSPTNAVIGDAQGVGTIVDNEPRISISDVTIGEGKKGQKTLFTFTITLSAAYDQVVMMSYRTVNGTATTGNADYVAKTGALTFAAGETTKTITVEVKGDSKKEANEAFYLDLFGLSSNALFTKNRGVGTILNDDK